MGFEPFKQLRVDRMFEVLNDDLNPIFLKTLQVHIFNPVLPRQICFGLHRFADIDKPIRWILAQLQLRRSDRRFGA